MEDFGSILWAVVLIGFAIFSVVAKGREKSGKHTHQEAWPAWDEDSEAQKALEAQNAEEEGMSEQYESAETHQEEAQSLEEIPEREYTSLEESATAMSGSLDPHTALRVSGRNAFMNNPSNALERTSSASDSDEFDPITDAVTEEMAFKADTADSTIDFDLRKAVIYSEMLKPKFEE